MVQLSPTEGLDIPALYPASIITPMRINLVTPFAEKDSVKALGARWDSARKVWYIQNVSDLTPFLRWIPDLNTATETASSDGTRRR